MPTFMVIVSIFMACMALPQVSRMYQTKSSKDQSIFATAGVVFGMVCWALYGLHIADYTIFWCNIMMICTYSIYLYTTIYYRIKNARGQRAIN